MTSKRRQQGPIEWLESPQILPIGLIAFLDKLLKPRNDLVFMVHPVSPRSWPNLTVETSYGTAIIHLYPQKFSAAGGECREAQYWKTALETCLQGYTQAELQLEHDGQVVSYFSNSFNQDDVTRSVKILLAQALTLDDRLGQPLHPLGGILGHQVRRLTSQWKRAHQLNDFSSKKSRMLFNHALVHTHRAQICGGQLSMNDVLRMWSPPVRVFREEYRPRKERRRIQARLKRLALKTKNVQVYYTRGMITGRGRRYFYFTFGQADRLVTLLKQKYPEGIPHEEELRELSLV